MPFLVPQAYRHHQDSHHDVAIGWGTESKQCRVRSILLLVQPEAPIFTNFDMKKGQIRECNILIACSLADLPYLLYNKPSMLTFIFPNQKNRKLEKSHPRRSFRGDWGFVTSPAFPGDLFVGARCRRWKWGWGWDVRGQTWGLRWFLCCFEVGIVSVG